MLEGVCGKLFVLVFPASAGKGLIEDFRLHKVYYRFSRRFWFNARERTSLASCHFAGVLQILYKSSGHPGMVTTSQTALFVINPRCKIKLGKSVLLDVQFIVALSNYRDPELWWYLCVSVTLCKLPFIAQSHMFSYIQN